MLLLQKANLPRGSEVLADKGYDGKPNDEILINLGYRKRIQKKGVRGNPLDKKGKAYNKEISKDRYKVERVFGSIKKWLRSGSCRYIGLAKTHFQHVL